MDLILSGLIIDFVFLVIVIILLIAHERKKKHSSENELKNHSKDNTSQNVDGNPRHDRKVIEENGDKGDQPIGENEQKTISKWSPRSWQGVLYCTLTQGGMAMTWKELRDATNLGDLELNKALSDLISQGDISKLGKSEDGQVRYQASEERYDAANMQRSKVDELDWINQWKEVSKLDFSAEHEHFFLERRHLDDFSKKLISHAHSEIIVANPFIQDCDLSDTLREAKRKGIIVQIITRPAEDKNPKYLKKKQAYHAMLQKEGISIFYDKRVHAKIIVADKKVAVVSSMNFYADSSAGASWEAGLVSTNKKVVQNISDFLSKMVINVPESNRAEQRY